MEAALAILLLFALVFIAFGMFLLTGRGWSMINMPEKAKAKWDPKALCRFVGLFILFMAFCFLLMGGGLLFGRPVLEYTGLTAMAAGIVFTIIKLFRPSPSQRKKGDIG